MPLDTSIPLNFSVPQFNVAPAQVGGPTNMLTDVMKLKGLQQEQQLNQLKFQEYQRARGDAATKRAEELKTKADLERIYGGISAPAGATNALAAPSAPANAMVAPAVPQMGFGAGAGEYTPAAPATPTAPSAPAAASASAPNYAGIIGELVKGGHIEEAKKMADLAKSHTETRGKEYENSVKQIDAAYAPLQALTNRVQSPADVAAYTQMLYNDPVLGPQAAKIKPLDQAIADSQREFAANPQQWQLAHSKVDGKVIYDAATNSVAPKIAAKDVGGSIKYIDENPKSPTFMKEVGDFAKTLSPTEKTRKESEDDPIKIQETFDRTLENLRDQYRKLGDQGMLIKPGETTLGNRVAAVGSVNAPGITTILSPERGSAVAALANMRQTTLSALMGATGMSAKQIDSNAEMRAYLDSLSNPGQPVQAIVDTLNNLSQRFGRGKVMTVEDITGGKTQNPPSDAGVPRGRRGALNLPAVAPVPASAKAPANVPQDVWNAMTPQERALF
jgi:hypothetical protein